MRGVLYRAVDFVADSGHAAGQAGGGAVCAIVAGFAVRDFRATGAAGGVREPETERGDVRGESRRGDADTRGAGAGDGTVRSAGRLEMVERGLVLRRSVTSVVCRHGDTVVADFF